MINPDCQDFDLETFLPYRLSILSNTLSQGIAQIYQERYGLAITEWRVLAVIGRYSGITANQVVDKTAMDKVAISRVVRTLIEKELIGRSEHKGDRRRKPLHLTERGKMIFNEVIPQARAYEKQIIDQLSEEEEQQLQHLINKLMQAAI